jgi:hypothetical protein
MYRFRSVPYVAFFFTYLGITSSDKLSPASTGR